MDETTSIPRDCREVGEVLSRVGDKWTMQAVVTLYERPRRFNELRRQMDGISQQMLTRTLRMLERDGMVARSVFPSTPPQVEYRLTALGRSLSEPVRKLAQWSRAHLPDIRDHRSKYDAERL